MEKDLIKNLSHDLRTPISIARGYAETLLLKKQMPSQESDKYVEIILKKILQIEHMVEQLFEISTIESSEFIPKKEPFVLSEIVQETINTYQLSTSKSKINLKCIQCQYHVWINADIRLMERVIQNLINYAINTTPENGAILMGMKVENNRLIFQLENNGEPMCAEELEWINDSQTEYRPGVDIPGSGLELSLSKKILHLHQSSLQAYNNDGNILTFGLDIFNRGNNL